MPAPASPSAATVLSGQRLKSARRAAGISQLDLARLIGVTNSTLSRLEAGQVGNPTWDLIDRYCDAVRCNPLPIIEPYFPQSLAADDELQVAS